MILEIVAVSRIILTTALQRSAAIHSLGGFLHGSRHCGLCLPYSMTTDCQVIEKQLREHLVQGPLLPWKPKSREGRGLAPCGASSGQEEQCFLD